MFVIMDERELKQQRASDRKFDLSDLRSDQTNTVRLAEYVVVVKQDTYLIIKDRLGGETGIEYPIEELPDVIRQHLIDRLKQRDNVGTDE